MTGTPCTSLLCKTMAKPGGFSGDLEAPAAPETKIALDNRGMPSEPEPKSTVAGYAGFPISSKLHLIDAVHVSYALQRL